MEASPLDDVSEMQEPGRARREAGAWGNRKPLTESVEIER